MIANIYKLFSGHRSALITMIANIYKLFSGHRSALITMIANIYLAFAILENRTTILQPGHKNIHL